MGRYTAHPTMYGRVANYLFIKGGIRSKGHLRMVRRILQKGTEAHQEDIIKRLDRIDRQRAKRGDKPRSCGRSTTPEPPVCMRTSAARIAKFQAIYWEDLQCDLLVLDEAQNMKNLRSAAAL